MIDCSSSCSLHFYYFSISDFFKILRKNHNVTDGRADGKMDNVKTVYPLKLRFAGGITIWSQIRSKLDQIQPWNAELASLDQFTKSFTYLRTIQNILMTSWLSGERSLSFGLLFIHLFPHRFWVLVSAASIRRF